MARPWRSGIGLALAAFASLALVRASFAATQSGTGNTGDLFTLLDSDAEVVCEDGMCRIVPRSGGTVDSSGSGAKLFPGYAVAARGMGERSAEDMVALLEGREERSDDALATLEENREQRRGTWERFAVAFFGGMLLNLTPCVLPMVPVTLMVLGIGFGKRGTARHPLWTGLAYGAGIATAYGALGVVSLAAGTAFGSLQSSPWFSAAVAVAMVALALAMFGVFSVDFSRFRRMGASGAATGERSEAARIAGAFGAGIGFALLAGACVAPVVLETLLASLAWQAQGRSLAWALPFALGAGMGFPWVLLGAGLNRWLPKPGRWMVWIERGFGIVALAFAVHYGVLAWRGFGGSVGTGTQEDGGIAWRTDAVEAFLEAEIDGKPIFVDLWATWCRSCEAMERGTLRDPRVVEAMAGMMPVRIQCEDPNSKEAVALFRELGFDAVRGLPAYAVLRKE